MTTHLDQGAALRARFTAEEMDDLANVIAHLGLRLETWPLPLPEVTYVVAGNWVVIPEGLNRRWRRWFAANGIAHWLLHRRQNEVLKDFMHVKIANLRYASAGFAFNLLVDVDEADRLQLRTPEVIAQFFGIPEEIVDAYQRQWLLPFFVTPDEGRIFDPKVIEAMMLERS